MTKRRAHDINTNEIAGRIMVALDVGTVSEARHLVEQLQGIPCYLKIGMQLYYATGPQFIKELKEQGYHIFLDLKLHDIPNTVKGAAHSLTLLGVDMFNVHAAGGLAMMQAAIAGVEQAISEGASIVRPTVIAVTQLTSTSQTVLNKEIGIPLAIDRAVEHYAKLAYEAGLQGVVASPLEVAMLKRVFGHEFITVTPGIRPRHSAIGDQARVMTPEEALAVGTDYLVIGRPITAAPQPRKALETIIDTLMQGL